MIASRSATAQSLGASRGETYEPSNRDSLLGPAPGSGASPLGGSPGAGEAILEKGIGGPGPRFIPEPFPQSLPQTNPEGAPGAVLGGAAIGPPTRLPSSPLSSYGSLALPPDLDDEGPADGLTLDQAIERLIRSNLDLYSKSFELPQAEADILTAGLRANPILYTDVQNVPYGSFSIDRPGGQTQYDINVSYPLDLTRKRRARTFVAYRAKCVLEAQFQVQPHGVGLAVPLPLFNRNQGNILRARLNVTQTQAEMLALEDTVVYEVRQAERQYMVTRASIARIENSLLPRARQEHDRVAQLYHAGKADELAFLTAERDYDQIVRQYRDVLVRHRRAMLKLNTAVGTRVLP